ncbi:preprotein translocase subunit SecA, partial [Buchnera aphidicola (Hormaphis cornu)]
TVIDRYASDNISKEAFDLLNLAEYLKNNFKLKISFVEYCSYNSYLSREQIINKVLDIFSFCYERKVNQIGLKRMKQFEKFIMLQTLDDQWKEHLSTIDYLRQGIHLRGYAQKDPKQEYKKESFVMFSDMLKNLKFQVISKLSFFVVSDKYTNNCF